MPSLNPNTHLCEWSAIELAQAIKQKRVSPVEAVTAMYERIHRINPKINAFCTLTESQAIAQAIAAEAAVMRGDALGLLHGVPISIKDLFFTKGVRTMRGSKIYENFIPEFDAPAVERVSNAGAISLGKTTTPEFGYKGLTDSLVTGMSRNPWKLNHSPGGSSGGAAAAIATGMGPLALGTDGAGSVRIPASFCGIFALKPTHGRVPYYPPSAIPMLAHTGPMTRTVDDAALLMQVLVGRDDRDIYSVPDDNTRWSEIWTQPKDQIIEKVRQLRMAWSPTIANAPASAEVVALCEKAALRFADIGCVVEPVALPFDNVQEAVDLIWACGMGAILKPYLTQWRSQIDPGLLWWIEKMNDYSAENYAQALTLRAQFAEQARQFFGKYDLLLTPTMPTTAFLAQPDPPSHIAGKAVHGFGYTPFTFPFNLGGQPAATVPCGVDSDGLPVGLQVVGRRYDDINVLRAASVFETIQPWRKFAVGVDD